MLLSTLARDVIGGASAESRRGLAQVGRYVITGELGAGGMGVVYTAHDPELGRTVAIKLLRGDGDDRVQERLRREARAMAKLAHPNVGAVYDVGSHDGRIFIAMEYVAGETLATWIQTPRTPREILDVYLAAGRGLAAAHAAGIVHRDFKPENVLLGEDGRPRVADFGLARAEITAEQPADPRRQDPQVSRIASPPASGGLTDCGGLMGTPYYIAPELYRGGAADAHSDQFSFCVALFTALFGTRPFDGDDLEALAASISGGQIREPGRVAGVPRRVRAAIQRGLQVRPADRFPAMDDLLVELTALTRASVRRQRRIQIGVAALVLGAAATAAALGMAKLAEPDATCSGAGEQVAAVWRPAVAAQLRSAFLATGRPHASQSAARVTERLADYTATWATMHRASCLATVRREQSTELLDRQMACLGRRLAAVAGLTELLIRSDGELVDRALDVTANLEPLAPCGEREALLAGAALPVDPVRRAAIGDLERQVDRADLERRAGHPEAAAAAARAVLAGNQAVDDALLTAQAGRVLGQSLDELGQPAAARDALVSARRSAERAGDGRLATQLLIDLTVVVGVHERRLSEADLLGELAEAAVGRPDLRGDPQLRARLLEALGSVANAASKTERAVELQQEVLAIRRRSSQTLPEELASAEAKLGNALANMSRPGEARAHYLEALAIRRRVLGDDHPLVANVHISLGATDMEESGDAVSARDHFRAALAILERMPGYRSYPFVLHNLGLLETTIGNHEQARKYLETAIAVRTSRLGPNDFDLAATHSALADVFYNLGDFTQALSGHRRAAAIYEHTGDTEHPEYGSTLCAIGEDLRRLGQPAEALRYHDRAQKIMGQKASADRTTGHFLGNRGVALFDLGRRQEAAPLLERALALIPPGEPDRARAAFALARIVDPVAPRSERTTKLADDALAIFTRVHSVAEREQVAAYLGRVRAL